MAFEELAQLRGRFQLAGSDDHLRVTRLPVFQRGQDGGGLRFGRVLDKDDAGTGKKAHGLDRVGQHGGVAAHFGGGHAGQAHFLFALGTDERGDDLLPFQGDAHPVGAVDQQAGLVRVGAGEIAGGVAGVEFHPRAPQAEGAAAIRRVTMSSARIVVSRSCAVRRAARVATVEPVAE